MTNDKSSTVFFCLSALTLAGCSYAPPPIPVCQVTGHLLVGGQPAPNAALAFHPLVADSKAACPVALTQADGSFQITTRATNDGAPAGQYIVTLVWPDDTLPIDDCECIDVVKHDRFHGLYASAKKSPLRATVTTSSANLTIETPPAPAKHISPR
jgi:hypothetical protein